MKFLRSVAVYPTRLYQKYGNKTNTEEINIFILIKESRRSKKEWVGKKNIKND